MIIDYSPDEVLEKVKSMGLNIHRNTLINYTREGLIPEPVKRGRNKYYPEGTPQALIAAYNAVNSKGYKSAKQKLAHSGQ